MSGIGRQAKIPSEHQQQALLAWLETRKHADRNRLIVLLSYKAGLRAKEIAALKWSMVMNADGDIGDHIHLTNEASKGKSGQDHCAEQGTQEATDQGQGNRRHHDCRCRTIGHSDPAWTGHISPGHRELVR